MDMPPAASLRQLIDSSSMLKSLFEETIALAKHTNPDTKTNPAQTLEQLYEYVA